MGFASRCSPFFSVICFFSRITVFVSFFSPCFSFYTSSTSPVCRVYVPFSHDLGFSVLFPCFSFYTSPTLLLFLLLFYLAILSILLLPRFSFYISYYLVFPYLALLSTLLLPRFSFYFSSTLSF